MNKLSYNKIITIVISVLVILTGLLLLLNTFSKPHVRYIEVDGGNEKAEFLDSKIRIYFSNPIQRTQDNKPIDFKQYISLEPSFDYNLAWNGNSLVIVPKETLSEDSSYKVSINPGYKDVYGNIIETASLLEFKTKPLNLIYLEKNFPTAKDKVISRNVKNDKSEVLIEEENIKQFSVNDEYIVVSTINSDKSNNIKTFNLNSRSKRDLELKNASVSRIDLSHVVNTFLFIYQEVKTDGQLLQPLSNNSIKLYNLDEQKLSDFNPSGTAQDVMDANFSPDGQSILYRSSESFFYLSPKDASTDPIAIGRFTGSGGFNGDGTKITFTNYDPLETYTSFPFITTFSSDRTVKQVTDGNTYVIDPTYSKKTNDIIFSNRYELLLGAQGLFKITRATLGEDGNYSFTDIFQVDDYSLEIPKPSWDDRYIVAEKYDQNSLLDFLNQRSFITQRKPNKGRLVIYDTQEKKILLEIPNGIEAEWSR